jgi:hypothetical protein
MAYFGLFGDKCVRQLLLGFAQPLVPLQSEEFRVADQRSFGFPLAVLKTHVGEGIRNQEDMPRLVVVQYGHALQSVTEATGGAARTLHDAFLAALAQSLREVRINFKGGGRPNGSFKDIFLNLMHAFVGVDEFALQKLNDITADLLVDFTNVGASAPGNGMQAMASSPLCRHWRIQRHWLAARIIAPSALRTLTSERTTPSSSARRLCPGRTCQRLAPWTTSSTGRRGARWGRSRPNSWGTAPLTDLTHTPP